MAGSQSGVTVSEQCILNYNELKLKSKYKWIIYKLSDNYKEIVVEDSLAKADVPKAADNKAVWEEFAEKLKSAKARYAVFDIEYNLPSGDKRSKVTFISYVSDDTAGVKARMVYASSRDAIKNALEGHASDVQAHGEEDLEWDSVLNQVSKNLTN